MSAMKKIKCFTTIHLWRIYVAGNNKTYLELYVKCQTVLSDFNRMWIFLQISIKVPCIKFHGYPSSGRSLADRSTD